MVDGSHSEPNQNPRARTTARRAVTPPPPPPPPTHNVLAAVPTPQLLTLSSLPLHLDRIMFPSLLSATLHNVLLSPLACVASFFHHNSTSSISSFIAPYLPFAPVAFLDLISITLVLALSSPSYDLTI
jgi:hypothetical protein